MSLPVPIRVIIFNMLGQQTQVELTDLTLVSKQVYEDCKRPGIEWKIIPTIEIRPRKQQGDDKIRGRIFMRNLTRHLQNNETNKKLQCYLHVRMKNIHKFNVEFGRNNDELFEVTKGIQLDGVLSLDISSSSARRIHFKNSFPLALSNILPNLHEINISNLDLYCGSLSKISRNCPLLEKVIWNYINKASHVYLNGHGMHMCNNLKEIHMNDSVLFCSTPYKGQMSNLTNPAFNNRFIFHRCCNALERVSIRNTRCYGNVLISIPQNALIKFVRNVPSLRWFRSDLTQENIDMLQLERPGIELLH